MSQEKKPQVDDLTKLRRILDNSSDPALESLLSHNEKTLESVRRRLHGDSVKPPSQSAGFFPRLTSMEPKVYVHEITPVSPRFIPPLPKIEPSAPLPKFKLVSEPKPTEQIQSEEPLFNSENLFEVEKADFNLPEFVEVTPREPSPPAPETEQQKQHEDTSSNQPELPEWQPVEEEHQPEQPQPDEPLTDETIPEFEQISTPTTPEEPEKQLEEEPVPEKQAFMDTSGEVQTEESLEPSFQILSKWETREAKKVQRAKEREAKKLQKIERKRSREVQKEEERRAKQTMEEQPPAPPLQEEHKAPSEFESTIQTSWMKIDFDAFNGIESIDEVTAELLYTHGYFSIDNIKDATLDDLVQIRGIRRKLAKQIKKEIEQKTFVSGSQEFVPFTQKTTKKKPSTKKLKDAAEWESYSVRNKPRQSSPSVCTYKGYTLFKRETTRNKKKTTIHFFSKEKPAKGHPTQLPDGYQIAVNKKTRVPYLKKTR